VRPRLQPRLWVSTWVWAESALCYTWAEGVPPSIMTSRIGTIALLAMLGTLFVLLFPAAHGPFTATQGPATAFRAAAAVRALLVMLGISLLITLLRLSYFSVTVDSALSLCAGSDSAPLTLRC